MPERKSLNIHEYLEMSLRRKWYIIVPFVISVIISFGVYKYLPKVYKATTLILVQPQRIPESYIRSTLTDSVIERLNTISQEILSRTRLEKIINEFNLYSDFFKNFHMEEIIEMMRKKIEVKVTRQNAFTISFENEEPRTVMVVTNKLASLFIEENLKFRESRAEGTSEFITKELQTMEDNLKKNENVIRLFKERNMGQLPQQLETNLRILERLHQQLQTTSENMRAAEDRSVLLQNQIEQLKARTQFSISRVSRRDQVSGTEEMGREITIEEPIINQFYNLKRDLASAQSKYKGTHPDVIDLKRKIANLEPKVKELLGAQEAERSNRLRNRQGGVIEEDLPPPTPDPNTERFFTQYTEQYNSALLEAKRAREEIKHLKEQINLYQRRVEDTPKKEQELVFLTRDYDLLKTNYQSLLDKKIQAQMAENLERKQQGEQFQILDPARLPEKPIKPDRNKLLLMGGVIGLIAGLGLAWFRESLDKSFHTVSDLEDYLGMSVVATIPNLKAERKGERKAA